MIININVIGGKSEALAEDVAGPSREPGDQHKLPIRGADGRARANPTKEESDPNREGKYELG